MGRESVSFQITGTLSRHNSDNDEIDDKLWKELYDRVTAIVQEKKYERIDADVV